MCMQVIERYAGEYYNEYHGSHETDIKYSLPVTLSSQISKEITHGVSCLYHRHAVDQCASYGQRNHSVQEKIILVGVSDHRSRVITYPHILSICITIIPHHMKSICSSIWS